MVPLYGLNVLVAVWRGIEAYVCLVKPTFVYACNIEEVCLLLAAAGGSCLLGTLSFILLQRLSK